MQTGRGAYLKDPKVVMIFWLWGRSKYINYTLFDEIKVACRVQIWKKIFCQNSDKFGHSFTKNFPCIYKKPIILSLVKIATLNFTMYTLTIVTSTLNINVIGLHKSNFNKHFFTIKDHSL